MGGTRKELLDRARRRMSEATGVVLTTHVNADGDGAGSEAALARWLLDRGKRVWIVNPTPFPDSYRFLLPEGAEVVDVRDAGVDQVRDGADLLVVLDTGEPRRVERALRALGQIRTVVIDHHPPVEPAIAADVTIQDTTACATGELIFDLIADAGTEDEGWARETVYGIYTAIVFDTGSFRFANTTPRTHAIAAELIRRGLDPEQAYRHLYGSVPLRRIRLLQAALERLDVDADLPITWITLPKAVMDALGATGEDLDGLVEHARSVEGTEVALLFRETDGSTKISFRSNGAVDVNALAREFGGGGHVKASGALVAGPVRSVRKRVLDATRAALRALEPAPSRADDATL